jgi:hypothetical protein
MIAFFGLFSSALIAVATTSVSSGKAIVVLFSTVLAAVAASASAGIAVLFSTVLADVVTSVSAIAVMSEGIPSTFLFFLVLFFHALQLNFEYLDYTGSIYQCYILTCSLLIKIYSD